MKRFVTLTVALSVAAIFGCASVPKSVKGLVDTQATVGAEAHALSTQWAKAAPDRAKAFAKAVEELDRAMQSVQAEEAKYALVFSSNQSLESRTKLDAAALAYMIAKIYLADQDGLSSSVKAQFADSEKALVTLSSDIDDSWARIETLQKQLKDYSEKSAVARVDANFVAALAGQVPGGSEKIDELLARATELQGALNKASSLKVGQGAAVANVRSTTGDLIELLERVKAPGK